MSEPINLPGAPLLAAQRSAPDASAEIRRVAAEFESVFLTEMLGPMFESLDSDGLGGGGVGERMFRPMLVERYAEAISRAGGVGVADHIIRELNRLQTMEAPDGADR